jgi:preprotein translocase subunit SecB
MLATLPEPAAIAGNDDAVPPGRWSDRNMSSATGRNGADSGDDKQDDRPQVNVLGQYVKDLSFENPSAGAMLRKPAKNVNLELKFNVEARKIEETLFEVALAVEGAARNDEGILYNIEMVYAGMFRLRNLPTEAVQQILYVDCPALLFPFVRRLLADLTREGGFPPLLLDPVDFAGLYRKNMASRESASAD